jgi:MFS transporter, DHA3 family, macrolide efflux protein
MNFRSAGFALGSSFYLLWCGESLASTGTTLLEFALGVWVYGHSGSVTAFAGVVIAATWPPILFLPLAGGLADRINRKYLIVGADLLLDAMIVCVIVLLWFGKLAAIHLYVFNSVASIVAAFRQPAYQASINALLPKDQFTRASGLIGLTKSISAMIAPLFAGVLMGFVGLGGVLSIDLAAFGIGTLFVLKAFSRLRAPEPEVAGERQSLAGGVLANLTSGMAFFKLEPLMLGLLVYVIIQSSLLSLSILMVTPLVLAGHSAQQLGLVCTFGALGGAAGATLLIAMRNPQRLMLMVITGGTVLSLSVVGMGIARSTVLYCLFAFLALASSSVADGGISALWMTKMPERYRGSILSLVAMLTLATMSAVMVGGGLVTDHVLEPALAVNGPLASSVGGWLGTGHGRGIAFLFVISGAIGLALCLATFSFRPMRRLDREVPNGSIREKSDTPAVDDPLYSPNH